MFENVLYGYQQLPKGLCAEVYTFDNDLTCGCGRRSALNVAAIRRIPPLPPSVSASRGQILERKQPLAEMRG